MYRNLLQYEQKEDRHMETTHRTYTLPKTYDSDCLLDVITTGKHCTVRLMLEDFAVDTMTYSVKAGRVCVPGGHKQSPQGAAQHAGAYWFVRPDRR
jgi:hypothetical protein